MKVIYTCDICRVNIKPPKLFGVHFTAISDFTLGGYGSTNCVHICYECATQLRNCLTTAEISKILDKEQE